MEPILPIYREPRRALAARVLLRALEHHVDLYEVASRGRSEPEALTEAEVQLLGACVVAR